MNGWMSEWTDGWMDRWMDDQRNGWVDGLMRVDGWLDGCMDGCNWGSLSFTGGNTLGIAYRRAWLEEWLSPESNAVCV